MNKLKAFRTVAILEGISYLLFAITMPLKYKFEILWPNLFIGFVHGVLFMIYLPLAILASREAQWSNKITFFALAASLIPGATFVLDKRVLSVKD